MAFPNFPAAGSNDWYSWATSVDNTMRQGLIRGQRTVVVAAASEPQSVKDAADYVCDNVADQVQINQALAEVGGVTIARGTNGGHVILLGREFTISDSILIPSQTELVGAYGKSGTWVKRASGWSPGVSRGMIELMTNAVQYTTTRHIGLDGTGGSVTGMYLHNDVAQEYDAFHTVNDMYIWNCGGDGLSTVLTSSGGAGRARGGHFSQIRMINAGRYGVNCASNDSFYDRIDTGSSGSHGFHVTNANNRFVNCKAWFSDGSGFSIASVRNQFIGCESQDNLHHGYWIQSAHNMLTGCMADSNAHGAGGSYDGFNIANHVAISGCHAFDKNEGGRGIQQRYGYNITNASAKVSLQGLAWQNLTGALNGTGASGSDVNVVNV